MIILEATPDLRTEIRDFNGGLQRITYELTKGAYFFSYSGDRLFYCCNEEATVKEPHVVWKVPTGSALPPPYLKYLGTSPGTTPIHYFCEVFEAESDFRWPNQ